MAKIFTVKEVAAKSTGPFSPYEWVLKESAAAVAKEVAKMMQPRESGQEVLLGNNFDTRLHY